MADFVKEVGNQVSRGVKAVTNSMNAPDYTTWMLIPFFVTFMVFSIFVSPLLMRIKETTLCDIDPETEEKKNCRKVKINTVLKVFLIIIFTLIVSFIIASIIYRVGVYIKNPKLAMGIETTRMINNAFN